MAKIIAVAENFAFGPIGKLLTVTKGLLEQGHEVTFIGYGTSYQLGSKEPFTKIIEINTDTPEFSTLMEEEFKKHDFVLSCMDRSSVLLAQKLQIPVIWLDILFWWWDSIPEYLLNTDCFIKQNTLKDEKNFLKYGSQIKNLHNVGPIIDLSVLNKSQKKKQVVVAYGGMEGEGWYKIGVDSNYPYTITDLLVNKIDFSNFEKVIFTGNERIINELGAKYGNEKFEFKALPHEEFTIEMASSEVVLMVPGLETPLEAFTFHVPTIFLPPSNSSQYVQLDEFAKNNATHMSIHFADYLPRPDFSGKNLKEMMQIFLGQLKVFENDSQILGDVAIRINGYLKNLELQRYQVLAQDKFIDSLGENGTKACLDIIASFIKNKK